VLVLCLPMSAEYELKNTGLNETIWSASFFPFPK
jgi:hypothetical protein